MSAPYDEIGLLAEVAGELAIEHHVPVVERVLFPTGPRLSVSALRWGTGDPEVVFLHGGAQNAHTWDGVALALNRSILAVDLPGHGHSDWRDDGDYSPNVSADAVAAALDQLPPRARGLVGMSLGGLTAMALAARRPDLVRHAVIVDVTPGTNPQRREMAASIEHFITGPEVFATFDELFDRALAHVPNRNARSLRRGVMHNARQLPDGRWRWRYDRRVALQSKDDVEAERARLWDALAGLPCGVTLVRGGRSPVVGPEDIADWRSRRPDDEIVVIDGAGHSVQGGHPIELATVLERVLFRGL